MPLMGRPGREHPATIALRAGSTPALATALEADLVSHRDFRDWRDVLIHLAPYHDAARRLGGSAAELFDAAAATEADQAPDSIADVARRFGRRTDVTPGAFGWRFEDTPEGPAYRFALAPFDPP